MIKFRMWAMAASAALATVATAADYFTAGGVPADHAALSSAVIRTEFTAIQTGFGKIAGYTGNGGKMVFINAGGTAQEAVAIPLTVARGGTGLTSGTSGGVPAYTASGTITSSAALAANQIVLGGGAGAVPATLGSLGTTTTVLHGNAAGAPTFGAVSLTADVSGTLPVANGGTGLASGTSGGVLAYTASGTLASSGALTQYGVLLGGGVGAAPTSLGAMTNGQLVVGSTGASPVVASLTAGANVTITPGAGTITIASSLAQAVGDHAVKVHTGNGHGSTNTKIRRYTTAITNVGTAITYADSAANGASFTINEDGLYAIRIVDSAGAMNFYIGISLNSAQLTTSISAVDIANRICAVQAGADGGLIECTATVKLVATDVIRPHTDGNANAGAALPIFEIRKIAAL